MSTWNSGRYICTAWINGEKFIDLISTCDSLLEDNVIDQILKKMVTGDNKRVVYNKVKHKKS